MQHQPAQRKTPPEVQNIRAQALTLNSDYDEGRTDACVCYCCWMEAPGKSNEKENPRTLSGSVFPVLLLLLVLDDPSEPFLHGFELQHSPRALLLLLMTMMGLAFESPRCHTTLHTYTHRYGTLTARRQQTIFTTIPPSADRLSQKPHGRPR